MFLYINNFKVIYTHHLFFQNTSLSNFTHHLCSQNTSNFSTLCQQVSTRRGGQFYNQLYNIMAKTNTILHPIALQQIQTVYCSVLTIRIGSLRINSPHRKIREKLFGSAGVGRFPGLINRCMF